MGIIHPEKEGRSGLDPWSKCYVQGVSLAGKLPYKLPYRTHNSAQREVIVTTCLSNLSASQNFQSNARRIMPFGTGLLNQSLVLNIIIF